MWIFDISPQRDLCGRMRADRVEAFPLELSASIALYPFAGKVTACIRAEEMISVRDIPAADRVRGLGELVSLTWEGRTLDPRQVKDVEIGEPYRSWLSRYFD